VTHHPEALLSLAGNCGDASEDRQELVRLVDTELSIVWADLIAGLPEEAGADLGPDSERARLVRLAIVGVWTTGVVFEMDRTQEGGAQTAARSTLAHRARAVEARIKEGKSPSGEWIAVHPSFDAFAFYDREKPDEPMRLAMQARITGQVKMPPIPGIADDDRLLLVLGRRYGLIEPDGPGMPQMGDGRPLAVLETSLADEILALPSTDAPPVNGKDTEAADSKEAA